ncbi:hypothetical protein [uncultured Tateyamaria sp.]|uniref:hypothetical protein n=1 Tax=uncultured Tateyamaria sp. TaxID=455651 RepID=UPI00260655C3|nr:hypothetical protein [uncultured Tateyamaria sp.]
MVPRQLVGDRLFAIVLAVLFGQPGTAQQRIAPEEFLARVTGKTVSFYDRSRGNLVGVEQFLSPRLSVWRGRENRCVYGEITTPDGQVCFLYRDLDQTEPVCWVPYDTEGTLMVFGLGRSFGQSQLARFNDQDLGCPEVPLS